MNGGRWQWDGRRCFNEMRKVARHAIPFSCEWPIGAIQMCVSVHYYSPNFICQCAKENANRSCGSKWIEGGVSACEQVCGDADDADDDIDDRCSWHIHCRRTFLSPFLCVVHQALSLLFFSTYSIYFVNVRHHIVVVGSCRCRLPKTHTHICTCERLRRILLYLFNST